MSGNPFMKLKFVTKPKNEPTPEAESSSQSFSGPSQSTQSHPSQSSPPSDSPAPTRNSLKIKLVSKGGSVPHTPAATAEPVKQKKSKAGRPSKPTAKLIDNRKRPKEEDFSDAEGSTIQVQPLKKLKLTTSNTNNTNTEKRRPVKLSFTSKTPIAKTNATPTSASTVKIKAKGKKPDRPRGDGYDSEASDREDDPHIEEQIIFRMFPGEECAYVSHCIKNRMMGIPKKNGGPDVFFKFYNERRGAVYVRGHWYASALVDLPCIVEGMKSWDKRGWWKSADICQMLWVFSKVGDESEAKTAPLPSIIDPTTYQYPHGVSAPMHNCRKTRFRKRLHRDEIEKVEREVQRLLDEDSKATSSKYQIFDPNARQQSQSFSRDGSTPARDSQAPQYSEDEEEEEEQDDNQDAEGEEDDGYFAESLAQPSNAHVQASFDQQPEIDADGEADFGDDFEAEMEAALEMNDEEFEAATPMSTVAATPAAGDALPENQEDSGDESVEDDDDDDDDEASEIDAEEKDKLAVIQGAREDILEMEKTLAEQNAKLAVTSNPILKKRLDATIRNLKQEIQLKKSSIGEGEGEE